MTAKITDTACAACGISYKSTEGICAFHRIWRRECFIQTSYSRSNRPHRGARKFRAPAFFACEQYRIRKKIFFPRRPAIIKAHSGAGVPAGPRALRKNRRDLVLSMIRRTKIRTACRVSLLIFSLLLAVLLAATYAGDTYEAFLNDRLQIETSYVVTDGDESPNYYYTSDYATQHALYEAKVAQI